MEAQDDSASLDVASEGIEGDEILQHEKGETPPVVTRAYQLEMFEFSMRSNVIVAMDTGSGKTWIAKLRIEVELARTPSKIVWFTAPSVPLAEQQYKYLTRHLPQYSTRLLTGEDNTQLWSTTEIWQACLLNVNLVISTPQILLDGLLHGFLHLQKISLLVFDEAHHCIAKHPSNELMQRYYHPLKHSMNAPELPHILGMTASPITTKLAGMDILEANLDATCKTPKQQLEDYRSYVNLPEFVILSYRPRETSPSLPIGLILRLLETVDIDEDPWVKQLLTEDKPGAQEKYQKVLKTRSTYSMDQLKKLRGNVEHLYNQLGVWATHAWLCEILLKLHAMVDKADWMLSMSDEEHRYLDTLLQEIRELSCRGLAEGNVVHQISAKAELLVNYLDNQYTEDLSCVIFVERRSMAWALTRLLQDHPSIRYRVASFVGSSNSGSRDNLIDLADLRTQRTELEEFRTGVRSVVVATSVMEEGIDVQATNLVIRFDDSKTVRSYIQSRGRARKVASQFVVLRNTEEPLFKYNDWTTLERQMKERYRDEMRQLDDRLQLEAEDEEDGEVYAIQSTGAKLTFDNARSHLEHFCQSLSKRQYEPNPRPTFICEGTIGIDVHAKVCLPSSLAADLREIHGRCAWRTEKAAKRDAAFEAFKRLHAAGLVNDHLLPPRTRQADAIELETRSALTNIRSQINPWEAIISNAEEDVTLHVYLLEVHGSISPGSTLLLLLPTHLDSSFTILLHHTRTQTFIGKVAHIGHRAMSTAMRALAQEVSSYLMSAAIASTSPNPGSWKHGMPFYILPNIPQDELRGWFDFNTRAVSLAEVLENPLDLQLQVLLRHIPHQRGYLSDLVRTELRQRTSLFAMPENIPAVRARKLPRRTEYLNKNNSPDSMEGQWSALPINECIVEQLSSSVISTMQFVPSIIHTIEMKLVAEACCKTLLLPLGISNRQLVAEALTSPGAGESTDYERLEFIGDTLLKLYASLQVFSDPGNKHLPEGYLTMKATNIESNARLQRAAIELGLDQYMMHGPSLRKKWKPEVASHQKELQDHFRETSTKTMADHMEALIAVAFLDDSGGRCGDERALDFLQGIIPEVQWNLPGINAPPLSASLSTDTTSFAALTTVEAILGYKFKQRSLLAEALNHSSPTATVPTYGRLEYLGDAVLQRIVNEAVFKAPTSYKQDSMHLRQAACVSHAYLAFLCLGASHQVERTIIHTNVATREVQVEKVAESKYLWQFMTHSNPDIAPAQQRSLKRYLELQAQIREELARSGTFPWALLASIAAPKIFSDMVESVLAAVFLDSGSSLGACGAVLETLGLTRLLHRLVHEPDVILEQPKTLLWQARAKPGLPGLKVVSRKYRDGLEKKHHCQLVLEAEVYAEFTDAWCSEEAVLRACEIGLQRFRTEQHMPEGEQVASQLSVEDASRNGKRSREDSAHSALCSMVEEDDDSDDGSKTVVRHDHV